MTATLEPWRCTCPPPGPRDRCWCPACQDWWRLNAQMIELLGVILSGYPPSAREKRLPRS
jgi:hypothetical protein